MAGQDEAPDALFSEAESYEQFMGRWSRTLAPHFVRFAGVRAGESVLDVGSGTGAVAAAIVAEAPSARVIGIDPVPAYVALAQMGLANRARFEVGNAHEMRFDDATFDRTLSMLVVNFIPDPRRAAGEMKRVTRGGGTVSAAVWDYGKGMDMLRRFWDAVVALRPMDEHKDERHMPFSRRGELATLWSDLGLRDIVEDELTIETRFGTFDDYWVPFTRRQGPAGRYLAGLETDQRDDLQRRLREQILAGRPDGPIVLNARAWAVRGVVS